jgi:1-phosphatidylinositol phosphodiesterase
MYQSSYCDQVKAKKRGKKMNLIINTAVFAVLIASTAAHWDAAYFRNSNDGFKERKNWMAQIRGGVRLSEMAIPGTHDSAANGNGNDILYTQTMNFDEQLRSGIRFFDMRVRHFRNSFPLHHGAFFLNKFFNHFLDSVHGFLQQNPSETVMFRLKHEHNADGNTETRLTTLDKYLSRYNTYLRTTSRDITLDQARGKFIILSNDSEFDDRGIVYGQSEIQDAFNLKTNWDLYGKWEKVKEHINKAANGNQNTFYINYLSGSGGSFPYFVASGHSSPGTKAARLSTGRTTPGWRSYKDFPRVNCFIGICTIAFEGTNILSRNVIKHSLNTRNQKRSVGIIIADFPGDDLINEIVRNNNQLCSGTCNF